MDYKSWLDFFSNISPVLSGAAQGSANGLISEANLTNQQNQGATSRYQALVNANRLQNIEQPQANLNQATQGTMLSTWKPVSVGATSVPYGQNTNGPVKPTITGGPSMTPQLQGLGAQVSKDAMSRQLAGNPVNTSTFPSDSQLGMTPMPEASWVDKLLGYGSTATSILGALGKSGLIGGGAAAPAGGAGAGITVGGGAGGTPMLGPGGSAAPTASTDPSILDWIKIGGGGGAGGAKPDDPYQDMLNKQLLNDFGVYFGLPAAGTPQEDRGETRKRGDRAWFTRR